MSERPVSHLLLACIFLLVSAPLARAEILCTKTTCDMTYAEQPINCKAPDAKTTKGTGVPCPIEPMPMKSTPLKSLINTVSPYLYAPLIDEEGEDYMGVYQRGTPGDPRKTYSLKKKPTGKNPQFAACLDQMRTPTDPKDPEGIAKVERLKLDNCANQYILHSAQYPYQKSNPVLLSGEDPAKPSARISLATHCQPLRTVNDGRQEYLPSHYLKGAWIKLLQKPDHRINPQAKDEPRLPTGIDIAEPLTPKAQFPEVKLSAVKAIEYEEILDPSHPFSPRWDFHNDERHEYSPKTTKYMTRYNPDSEPSVFCAGVRRNTNNQGSSDNLAIPVDILSFRKDTFDKGITNRIEFNKKCHDHTRREISKDIVGVARRSYCYDLIPCGFDSICARSHPCGECFGLTARFRVDGDNRQPPCATHWSGNDIKIKRPKIPGALNGFSRVASCNPTVPYKRNDKQRISELCKELRRPYSTINKLKMRYHNENDTVASNITLKGGVPEGFTHKEYFSDHMPYPRLWDTGRSIQKLNVPDQDPMDVKGQYTAIVGVGREATPTNGGDQRCLYGGWGEDTNVGGATFKVPDPITSWTELKLYQARTLRQVSLSCIARYEKVFKPGSAEAMVLLSTGAERKRPLVSECKKGGTECETADLDETSIGGKPGVRVELKSESWPQPWRGYLSADNPDWKFPDWKNPSVPTDRGLDNAERGDIVILDEDDVASGVKMLPRVGVVVEVNTPKIPSDSKCDEEKNCYVKVVESDNGKWPDICGTTDGWAEQKTRYLRKPGHLPPRAKEEYDKIGTTDGCDNLGINDCVFEKWSDAKLYRIRQDKE